MFLRLPHLAAGWLLAAGLTAAAEPPLTTLTTVRGKVYTEVRVLKVYPDGLTFRHGHGMAKIPFAELPPAIRERFHHEVERAEQYAREQEKLQQEARAQLARQREETRARQEQVRRAAEAWAARRPEWAEETAAPSQPFETDLRATVTGYASPRRSRWPQGHGVYDDRWRDWHRPYRILYTPNFYYANPHSHWIGRPPRTWQPRPGPILSPPVHPTPVRPPRGGGGKGVQLRR